MNFDRIREITRSFLKEVADMTRKNKKKRRKKNSQRRNGHVFVNDIGTNDLILANQGEQGHHVDTKHVIPEGNLTLQNSIENKHFPPLKRKNVGVSYLLKVVGLQNQFTPSVRTTAGCTILSLEAILNVLLGANIDANLVGHVLKAGSYYTVEHHTGFQEVYDTVSRYQQNLVQLESSQETVRNFNLVIKRMRRMASDHGDIAVVLTKPPESVALICFERPKSSTRGQYRFVLWDSHKRQIHDGAAFLLFETNRNILYYLCNKLFPHLHLGDDVSTLHQEMYNTVEVTTVKLKKRVELSTKPLEQTKKMMKELNKLAQKKSKEHSDLIIQRLKAENQKLRQELRKQEIKFNGLLGHLSSAIDDFSAGQVQESSSIGTDKAPNLDHVSKDKRSYDIRSSDPLPKHKSKEQDDAKVADHNEERLENGSLTCETCFETSQRVSTACGKHQMCEHCTEIARGECEICAIERNNDPHRVETPNVPPALSDEEIARQLQQQYDNEKTQIELDSKAASDLYKGSIFECSICFDKFDKGSVFYGFGCKHTFCRECAANWTREEMLKCKFPVRCPECMDKKESKMGEFSPNDVVGILEPKEFKRYQELSLQAWQSAHPNVVQCITVDCKGIIELHPQVRRVTCPVCSTEFCRICKGSGHPDDVPCQDPQVAASLQGYAQDKKCQKCGSCGMLVEKNKGCNHMTCRCGNHFCYLCGTDLDPNDLYSHFKGGFSGKCIMFKPNDVLY